MLDNGYVYLAATRLSLFRSEEDWAMVFEVFGFSPRTGLPDIHVSTFATQLHNRDRPDQFVGPDAYREYVTNSPHSDWRFFYPIEEGDWIDSEIGEMVAESGEFQLRDRVIPLP